MHSVPELGDRPQAIINRQLVDGSDLLVGVFWARLGTPTGQAESGSAEEIERFRAARGPVLLYFSSLPVNPDRLDPVEFARLQAYKTKLRAAGLLETFASVAELREKLFRHLTEVTRPFAAGHERESSGAPSRAPDAGSLSHEQLTLLKHMAEGVEGVAAEDVAEEFKISVHRARLLFDALQEKDLVGASRAVGRPNLYSLSRNGRAVLASLGLI